MTCSVIIPTCHRNDRLAECLDRLAPGRQTLDASEYEVIVTDDGAETTAEAMVRDRYPWARWVAGPRRGPAANRNNGARHARGEWLAFVDDDCLPDPGWLAGFMAAAEAHPSAQVLEGKTTCNAGLHSPLFHAPINLTGGWLWSCNLAVRRSFFTSLGGFDEAFPRAHMEDVDFRDRVAAAGVRPVWVPAASADHPPRRLPLFRASVGQHECEVIYQLKQGREPRLAPMLFNTCRARAKSLRRYPVRLDSLVSGLSAIVEAFWFAIEFRQWVRSNRHVGRSAAAPPARVSYS